MPRVPVPFSTVPSEAMQSVLSVCAVSEAMPVSFTAAPLAVMLVINIEPLALLRDVPTWTTPAAFRLKNVSIVPFGSEVLDHATGVAVAS